MGMWQLVVIYSVARVYAIVDISIQPLGIIYIEFFADGAVVIYYVLTCDGVDFISIKSLKHIEFSSNSSVLLHCSSSLPNT